MEKVKNNKDKWLHLRLSEYEEGQLKKYFAKSTCRKLSDYARKVLLGKPIISTYRNRSLDDFMAEATYLRMELKAIGNNFNQAVRKLNSMDSSEEVKRWAAIYEQGSFELLKRIEIIEKHISKLADQWLQ